MDGRRAKLSESAPPPLSVFLIVKNEAARLPRTLDAIAGLADQVVVVDSGSDDDTVAIARARGAEVHFRAWSGYGPQKRFAESLCRNDWVLNLDADEVATPELAAEIRARLRGAAPGAFSVPSLKVLPGDDRPRPFAGDHEPVRLYHLGVARYRDHPLFDRVETTVPVQRLRAPLHHFTVDSWSALVAKENAYTDYVARTARPRARWSLRLRLLTEGPWIFFKTWVLRGNVFGGWKGFAFSVIVAFSRWLRIVKLLERAERRDRDAE